MPLAATWMALEIAVLSEVRHRDRHIVWYCLYEESKKKWCKWNYLQNRNGLINLESELVMAGETGWRGTNRGLGIDMYTLLYLKWMTGRDLLCSTENSAQCYVAAWMGGEFGENGCICVYDQVPLRPTWSCHNIVNWLYSYFQKKVQRKKIVTPLDGPITEASLWGNEHTKRPPSVKTS